MKNAREAAGRLSLSLNGLATDLDTEHGQTRCEQVGRGETGRTAAMPPTCTYETERDG